MTLAFSAATYSINENDSPAAVAGQSGTTLTPSNGTATAPADYTNTPAVLNSADGDSTSIAVASLIKT